MVLRILPMLSPVMAAGAFAPGIGEARSPGHCPPGLAKKDVPCVPPGQVRKSWAVGESPPHDTRYVVIEDYWRYDLPRPPHGPQYVRVDNDVLRIVVETARVVERLQTIGRLLS